MTIQKKNIEYSKLKAEIVKNATLKECFLENTQQPCKGKIINAHSLQKLGSLAVLEREINGNKKIYTLTEKKINPDTGEVELIPIGKKSASTFFGFCNYHDKIFNPIEQNPDLIDINSDEHCFLLSFRAFAISYHRKKEDIYLLSTKDEDLREKLKKYFGHNNIDAQLEGEKLELQDLGENKKILVNALYSKDYTCMEFFAYEVPYSVPFAVSMLTSPPYFFSGSKFNISNDQRDKYSDIFTSILPLKNKTVVVLASMMNDEKGIKYLDELDKMPILLLEKALTWHTLTNAENCFFSPELFEKISDNDKRLIIYLNEHSASFNTPYLKFNPKKFKLNLFDKKYALNK